MSYAFYMFFRIRVQAVNAIGVGSFSSVAKCSTRPLPPSPPTLECVLAGHNHLKLRWGDGKNLDFIHYTLEMQEEDREEYAFQTRTLSRVANLM
jgi:hypothetical protein